MKIEIRHRITKSVIYETEAEDLREAVVRAIKRGADLGGADLGGAYLGGADLGGADLRGADLGGAYLRGAKNYQNSHDLFFEVIRRQRTEEITTEEWSMIGILSIHRICWPSIKERFGDAIVPLFKKVAEWGFPEYLARYERE